MSTSHPVWEEQSLDPNHIKLVRVHLEELKASHFFAKSRRAQDFLQLIVEHALAGEFDSLRERVIGSEMFGRPISYDTANDSVVRVKASEVRKKLALFYVETDHKSRVRIEIPSGSYVPRFHFEPLPAAAPPLLPVDLSSSRDRSSASHQDQSSFSEKDGSEKSGANRAGIAETIPFRQAAIVKSKLRFSWRLMAGMLVALGLLASGYVGFRQWFGKARQIRSIVILPFQDLSGDPKQDYFADGMTEELTADLGQVSELRVISRLSAMSYKGTKKTLPEIAQELGVDGVIEGSVMREANQVRITAELIDARNDRHIWAHTYVRDMTSVLALQGEAAQAIADEVSIKVTPEEEARLARARPVNQKAQDLYLQGMLRVNTGDVKDALGYFREAIEKDPNSAQAHAALAASYGRMGESGILPYAEAFFMQRTEALRAIELDEALPDGHVELANASMNLNWDWVTAAKEFRRAHDLNPNSAFIHERYAVFLERSGRLPEAIAEVERGTQVDPRSSRSFRNAASTYYFSRQYDHALELVKKACTIDAPEPQCVFPLGDIYAEKGMYTQAIRIFRTPGEEPHALGHLGNAYARDGQIAAAQKTISLLEEHVRGDGVGRYEIALVYAGLHRKEEAFRWLEESYRAHDEGLTNLKIDPCLDPLRSDPRFDGLVQRVGLVQ